MPRLEYKKSIAGVIMVRNFVERLDHFLGELMQALYAGETLAAEFVRGLLTAVAVWCRAVTMWIQQLKPSDAEYKDLQVSREISSCNTLHKLTAISFVGAGQARRSPAQVSRTFAFEIGAQALKQRLSSTAPQCHAFPSSWTG
jgi:hypothetical protein